MESDRNLAKSVTESTVDGASSAEEAILKEGKAVGLGSWLYKPKFYLFGVCYMCARLNSNVFGTFLPFYLVYTLQLGKSASTVPSSVALVPLFIYSSSTLLSTQLAPLYYHLGRKNTLLLGTLLSLLSLALLFLLTPSNNYMVYPLALLIGCSQSLLLATSINLISDVVGSRGDSGAVVFGVYSFLDKVSAGVVIYLVAKLPCFAGAG